MTYSASENTPTTQTTTQRENVAYRVSMRI